MDLNIIRALIFLTAGLIVIFLPKHVNKFQNGILKIVHINYRVKIDKKANNQIGGFFILISLGLFIYVLL